MDKYLSKLSFNDFFSQSHTKRYHSENTVRVQCLAEHSHRVAFIAVKLLYAYAEYLDKRVSTTLTDGYRDAVELGIHRYTSIHDVVETQGGADVATHIKAHLREQYGVELNPLMHRFFWKNYELNEDDYAVDPLVKALVSLADTLEGKVFAHHNIPNGTVRTKVLEDWDSAWYKKLDKFGDLLDKKFLYETVDAYYRANLYLDSAWA